MTAPLDEKDELVFPAPPKRVVGTLSTAPAPDELEVVKKLQAIIDDFDAELTAALGPDERPDLWDGGVDVHVSMIRKAHSAIATLMAENEALRSERDALRKALEFYAKPENYKGAFVPGGHTDHGTFAVAHHVNAVRKDAGETARQALSGTTP